MSVVYDASKYQDLLDDSWNPVTGQSIPRSKSIFLCLQDEENTADMGICRLLYSCEECRWGIRLPPQAVLDERR